jgi:hypothetical protein
MPFRAIILANTAKNNIKIEVIGDYRYRRVGTLLALSLWWCRKWIPVDLTIASIRLFSLLPNLTAGGRIR